LETVDRQHQCPDIAVGFNQLGRVLLPGREHRLIPANIRLDRISGQPDPVRVVSLQTQLWHRPMAGKATMAKPAQHIPAQTPARHADGQFGFGAERAPPTLA